MSSEKEGWFSAVTKLFSTGQKSDDHLMERTRLILQNSPGGSGRCSSPRTLTSVNGGSSSTLAFESTVQPSRNLRYLSPSVLETGVSKPSVSKPIPSEDIFLLSSSTSRKRALTQEHQPTTTIDASLTIGDNPKRTRREQFTNSMLEDATPTLFSERLNSTWMGRTTEDSLSCVDFSRSPSSSNRSLIGRIGSNRSNTSSLSSKTRAILSHLERINTPAREARKLPIMRGSTLPPERWAPLHSAAPPPLVKTAANVPSRIQLLSSSLASHRKPYWRDITRNLNEQAKSSSLGEGSNNAPSCSNSVHPLFDMDKNEANSNTHNVSSKATQETEAEGSGKSSYVFAKEGVDVAKGSNVFNANDLVDEEMDEMTGTVEAPTTAQPKNVPLARVASLNEDEDNTFIFAAPVERLPGQGQPQTTPVKCSDNSSDDSGSSSDDSEDERSTSGFEAEAIARGKEQKPSRPPTAADSETSGAVSSNITPSSSNEVSPQAKAESSWSCPDCFITNKNVSVCAACGHNKDAPTASKTLVSNLSTIGKSSTSTFSFGCSAEGPKDSAVSSSTNSFSPKKDSGGVGSSEPNPAVSKISFGGFTSAALPSSKTSVSEKQRVAWECPDCMVQNKESDDKCVCCGHVMYSSDEVSSSSNTNAFGNRTFKPIATNSAGVSFGFGSTSSSSETSGGVKFGFGTAEKQTSTTGTDSNPPKRDLVTVADEVAPMTSGTAKGTNVTDLGESSGKKSETVVQNPTFSFGTGSAIFGAGAKPPLFGSSSSSTAMFNTSFSSGSLLVASATTAPEAVTTAVTETQAASTSEPIPFVFGSSSSGAVAKPFGLFDNKKEGSSAVKSPSFGNGLTFGTTQAPSESVSSCSDLQKPTSNADTTSKSLFGSSSGAGLFGASAPSKPMFSFGSSGDKSNSSLGTAGKPLTDIVKASPFGSGSGISLASGEAREPLLFGASSTNPATASLFGQSVSTGSASSANGGLGFNFGANSGNAFRAFGTGSAPTSSVLTTPSTTATSLVFGNAPVAADTSKPFSFSTEPTFQFGQTSALSGTTPFQFGSSQLAAAPMAPSFQSSGVPAPAAASSNFSFTSSNTRKMVAARRRLPQRK